jgi:hypothetical protein
VTMHTNPTTGDTFPRPDPTVLTTDQLRREIAALREIIETRMQGMDRATQLLQATTNRIPSDVDTKVDHLKTLHEEKFHSIEIQFHERDVRAEQTSRDTKTAVDAALQAAKEAVGAQTQASDRAIAKSETATTKQIDQITQLIQSNAVAQDAKISDLKDRLLLIEGRGSGFASSWVIVLGALGGIGTIAGLIALVMALTGR